MSDIIKCLMCGVEPSVTKRRERLLVGGYGTYTLIRCPKCGFSTGGSSSTERELKHFRKVQEYKDKQLRFKL